jgi:hypothetical protein
MPTKEELVSVPCRGSSFLYKTFNRRNGNYLYFGFRPLLGK